MSDARALILAVDHVAGIEAVHEEVVAQHSIDEHSEEALDHHEEDGPAVEDHGAKQQVHRGREVLR